MFAQLPSDARNGGSTLVSLIGTQMPRKYKIALPNVNTQTGEPTTHIVSRVMVCPPSLCAVTLAPY